MNAVVYFIRRSVCRLALTLGIFCYIEVIFHLTEGTNPNFQFPWGHYVESVAVMGALFLMLAWLTWTRPRLPPASKLPAEKENASRQ